MKTLSVEEASRSLGDWLRRAVGGEQIAIHEGGCAVLLQPLPTPLEAAGPEQLSPREALRLLQEESSLTQEQADRFIAELRNERLATEDGRRA